MVIMTAKLNDDFITIIDDYYDSQIKSNDFRTITFGHYDSQMKSDDF
jgi:hypothetical protein